METTDRLKNYLAQVARKYPEVWKQVDEFRSAQGNGLPNWPQWCFLPLAGAVAITSRGMHPVEAMKADPDSSKDIAIVGALAAWRVTQGIYCFHPELFKAVWETSLEGELPVDLFFRLPEWCVYVETPGEKFYGSSLSGFFAHLEYDVNDRRHELRLLLDTGEALLGIPLHLSGKTIQGAIERAQEEVDAVASRYNQRRVALDLENQKLLGDSIKPLVSLVLYLCSEGSDLGDHGGNAVAPVKPRPIKTKKGVRFFPAERQRIWEVGSRIGAALERAYTKERISETEERNHASPRPHIRRAHWHTFLTGPRNKPDEQKPVVKWLPPIPVAMGNVEELVPTVRSVH